MADENVPVTDAAPAEENKQQEQAPVQMNPYDVQGLPPNLVPVLLHAVKTGAHGMLDDLVVGIKTVDLGAAGMMVNLALPAVVSALKGWIDSLGVAPPAPPAPPYPYPYPPQPQPPYPYPQPQPAPPGPAPQPYPYPQPNPAPAPAPPYPYPPQPPYPYPPQPQPAPAPQPYPPPPPRPPDINVR